MLPQFSSSSWSPQAWTKARWLMRANTGTLQIAASAVAVVVEPCWAAPFSHAAALSSVPEPAASGPRPPPQDLAAAAGAPAQSPHRSQLPRPLSRRRRRGHLRQPAKAPVPKQSLVSPAFFPALPEAFWLPSSWAHPPPPRLHFRPFQARSLALTPPVC